MKKSNKSSLYDVKNVYHFAVRAQSTIEEFDKRKLTDEELIYRSVGLMFSDIQNKEVKRILGKEAYDKSLELIRPIEYGDIKENLEVFDWVMYKYKDVSKKDKLNFLEKIVGRNEKGFIIPFAAAKIVKKYFTGNNIKLKMEIYRNALHNLN